MIGESWQQILLKIVDECSRQRDRAGNIDFRAVKAQVLKSQPPRMGDVPDMVDFVKVWGGLPSGYFVKELCDLCTNIPSDRVVSGTFFKSLANLKDSFTAKTLPTHLINAIIFAHASRDEQVQDGIARYITKGEISSIGNKDKRDIVFAADGVIKRGKALVKDLKHDVQMEVLGKLQFALVMQAIGRKGWEDVRTVDEIASEFAKEVCEKRGIVDPQQQHQQQQQTSKASASDESAMNAIMYTNDGDATAVGRACVINKGFNINMIVVKKKGGDKCDQWKIHAIAEDGTVELLKVYFDGSVAEKIEKVVEIDPFLEEYKEGTKIETIKSYPKADPRNNCDLKIMVAKGQMQAVILRMLNDYDTPKVWIMSAPEKKVLSNAEVQKGDMIIVPATMLIEVHEIGSKHTCPRKSIECKSEDMGLRFFLNPQSNSKEFVNPFWNIKMVGKREEANMELEERVYRMKLPTGGIKNCNPEQGIQVFVAVNTKKIVKNEELVIFKEGLAEVDKTKKATSAIIDVKSVKADRPTKKQKVE